MHLLRQQQAAHCKNTYHAHSILYRHIDTLKHTHTQYLLLSTVYELEFICPLVALLNSFVLPQNFCVLIEFLKKEMYSHSFKFQSSNINSFWTSHHTKTSTHQKTKTRSVALHGKIPPILCPDTVSLIDIVGNHFFCVHFIWLLQVSNSYSTSTHLVCLQRSVVQKNIILTNFQWSFEPSLWPWTQQSRLRCSDLREVPSN